MCNCCCKRPLCQHAECCDADEINLTSDKRKGKGNSPEAQRVNCEDSVVIEFPRNDFLHSIEFIPVGNNGHGGAENAYMNINVYKRHPKNHPKAGEKDCMDARASFRVASKNGEPTLSQLMNKLNVAAQAVYRSVGHGCCCCHHHC